MTYGEAHVAELNSIQLVAGEWKQTLHITGKPRKPMSRSDAVLYYNTKLFGYWLDVLNDISPKFKRHNETRLKIQMFGHPDFARLLKKEKPCGD